MVFLKKRILSISLMVFFLACFRGWAGDTQTLVVFYSHSGKTKTACELIAKDLKADLIEVKDLKNSSDLINRYTKKDKHTMEAQKPDAAKGDRPKPVMDTEISPASIDFSKYSRIVIGSPVWMGGLAPAIKKLLSHYRLDRKKVVLLTTATAIVQFPHQKAYKDAVRASGAEVAAYYQIRVINDQKKELAREELLYEARKLLPAIRAVLK